MKVLRIKKKRESPPNREEPATRTVRRRRPRAVRLPTDPSVVTLARRAHAGTAVPQAPEALTGSPELPSLGDRGTLGREGWGGLGLAGSQRPRLAALRYSINRSRSVLIMIIETDGLPMHSVALPRRRDPPHDGFTETLARPRDLVGALGQVS